MSKAHHATVSHSTKHWLNKTAFLFFFEGPLSHKFLTTLHWYRFHLENSHLHHAGICDNSGEVSSNSMCLRIQSFAKIRQPLHTC